MRRGRDYYKMFALMMADGECVAPDTCHAGAPCGPCYARRVLARASELENESRRARSARWLVYLISSFLDHSYSAHGKNHKLRSGAWARSGHLLQKPLFPIARRLDKDAMGDQMAEECWWG